VKILQFHCLKCTCVCQSKETCLQWCRMPTSDVVVDFFKHALKPFSLLIMKNIYFLCPFGVTFYSRGQLATRELAYVARFRSRFILVFLTKYLNHFFQPLIMRRRYNSHGNHTISFQAFRNLPDLYCRQFSHSTFFRA
jgi:hypothetical protein